MSDNYLAKMVRTAWRGQPFFFSPVQSSGWMEWCQSFCKKSFCRYYHCQTTKPSGFLSSLWHFFLRIISSESQEQVNSDDSVPPKYNQFLNVALFYDLYSKIISVLFTYIRNLFYLKQLNITQISKLQDNRIVKTLKIQS